MSEHRFALQVRFTADNIEEAEDFAVAAREAMIELRRERALRTGNRGLGVALWYADPISGEDKLWADPVMDAEVLADIRAERVASTTNV